MSNQDLDPAEPEKRTAPPARTRTRSPAYPSMSLKNALEKAQSLWHAANKHDTHIESAMAAIGYPKKTGPAIRALSALQQFGLVSDSGSGSERRVKLTELAQDLVLLPENDARRQDSLVKAALSPTVYHTLWNRYGASLPDNDVIRAFLVRDKGFNEKAVPGLLADYRETIELAEPNTKSEADQDSAGVEATRSNVPAPIPSPAPKRSNESLPLTTGAQYFSIPTDAGDALIPLGMSEQDFELFLSALELFKVKIVAP